MTTTTDPLIRLLGTADADAYQALRLQSLTKNPQAFLTTLKVEQEKTLSNFAYELNAAQSSPIWGYYGLFLNQELVGFCQISKSPAVKKSHLAFLHSLYIDTDYRGQGLAKKLMATMLKKIKSQHIEIVLISYLAKNRCLRGFYDHFGFVQCGLKPKAIKENGEYDDEVEMFLEI